MPDPTPPRPMRVDFHHQLDAIDDAFVAAAVQVAEALPRLTTAFLDGDRDVIEGALELSVHIGDTMESVEERGFVLLALEAPVASDLRRLVALLRMTVDVDRSAALLKAACGTLDRIDPRLLPERIRMELREIADRATGVYVGGVDAWRQRDALAVYEVDDADEHVDRLQESLLAHAADIKETGDEMLVLGLLARYYERIADHGVLIAQNATFVATGQRVLVGKRRAAEDED